MAKNPGKGTLLKHGVGSGSITYTTITQRVSIDGPDAKVGTINVSDLDSTAAEYRPTLPDGGEVSMQIWYDPAGTTHKLLTGLWTAPSVEHWELVFADTAATAVPFDAILTGFKPGGMDVEGFLMADVKFQITGPIAWPT